MDSKLIRLPGNRPDSSDISDEDDEDDESE
jgi:hypothetical protein